MHGGIMAFEAATGKPQWLFQGKLWHGIMARNDFKGVACLPAHWSAPVITANGKVLAERVDGFLYSVQDTLQGHREPMDLAELKDMDYNTTPGVTVEVFDADRSSLHGALAFAPGTMAFTTCDSLFVFRY